MSKFLFYIDVFKNQGGAQRVMANIMDYLLSNNHEVILVTDFNGGFSLYNMNLWRKIKKFSLTESNQGNKLFKNIKKITNLRKIIKQERPNLCLSFLGLPNIRLLVSKTGLRVPCVISIRSDPNVEYGKKTLIKFFVDKLFRHSSGIIIQTEFVKNYFSKRTQELCKVIYNPVNDLFYNKKRSTIQKNIVTFGSLLECKNHKMLIDAYCLVADDFPNDDLYIYGEGDQRGILEEYVREKNIENRVHFPGIITNVVEKLCESKMFILTSNYEGMPNALMEAMATGTPCISTNCPSGGPRTLITNDNEGILIDCGDYKELALQMIQLKDDKKRSIMSYYAKERAKDFKGEKVLNEWAVYLFSLMKKR